MDRLVRRSILGNPRDRRGVIVTTTNMLLSCMKLIDVRIAAVRGRNPEKPSERKRSNGRYRQRLEIGGDCSNTVTTVQKDNYVIETYAE